MLTLAAYALMRRPGVSASRDPEPAAGDVVPIGVRAERALLLLGLASRAAYCLYAAAVVILNFTGYHRPGLAGAALLLAVLVSAGLGFRVWHEQAFSGLVAVLDPAGAVAVLLMVAAAIRRPDQSGSLNWALAYGVACAIWLGLGGRLGWRPWLACLLGAVYGVAALRGGVVDPIMTITALLNATSAPMYFGIAAAITWVVRRIAAEKAAEQALEQVQRRSLAALGERERLVGQIHQSVLVTLEEITSGQVPWNDLRGRAMAQVGALREAFGEPKGICASEGLRALLAALGQDRAGDGWRIDLIDEEVMDEPTPAAACALRDAMAELIDGPAPDGCPLVRAQVRADSSLAELLIRMPGDARAMAGPVARARARLAPAAGTAELLAGLAGEVRVRLRVPA